MKKILLIIALCAAPVFGAQNTVQLVSKEGAKTAPIARDLLLKPMVSGLTKTSLEHDDDATEVPLPSVKIRELTKLKPVLEFIGNRVGTESFDDLPATEQRDLVLAVGKALGGVKESEIVDLIGAANYLDSRPLLEALLRRYAGFLGRHKQQVMARIRDKDKIPKDLWPAIARNYFLQLGEDIPGYERITIPVPVLEAYGYLSSDMLKQFPNLATNPNQPRIRKVMNRTSRAWPVTWLLGEWMVGQNKKDALKNISGLLKIKGIDLSLGNPLGTAGRYTLQSVVDELLRAGADINEPDYYGIPPLVDLVHAYYLDPNWATMLQYFIARGASLDTALKYAREYKENKTELGPQAEEIEKAIKRLEEFRDAQQQKSAASPK